MKKVFVRFLAAFFAALLLISPAYASGELLPGEDGSDRVMDAAGVLSDNEKDLLEQEADRLSGEYQCDVLIATAPGLQGMQAWQFTEKIFQQYGLGYGEDRSCILLMLAMEDRDYDIMAYGYGNTVFTDWAKEVMSDRFLPYFAEDDYYGGFFSYLASCEEFLRMAGEGTPFDYDTDPQRQKEDRAQGILAGIGVSVVFSAVLAFGVCQAFKSQMKTAKMQTMAHNYISGQGLVLTHREDRFTHTTRSRRKIERNTTGGSRGGTRINSGGFSHRSGKF